MDWKFFMIAVIVMPVLMLAYFLFALVAPQLGLVNVQSFIFGAVGSLVLAFPVSWVITKKLF